MTTQPTGVSAAGPGLVEVTGLTKSYRSTPALRDYNLSLESGHIVGLMGPNGCGKTTLLKILAGVLSRLYGHRDHQRARARRRHQGDRLLPARRRLPEH